MKVTRSGEMVAFLKGEERKANIGCNKCPNCGEQNYGTLISKTWAEGWFKNRSMKVNCYSCDKCGCQWESEPYQWA